MSTAGNAYYRTVEETTLDRDGLRGDDFESWLRDRIGSAESVLTGLLKYYARIRKERSRLKLPADTFEPSPGVFQNMQALLAATRPEAAIGLRERFVAATLPVTGFDHPYKPEPCSAQQTRPDHGLHSPNGSGPAQSSGTQHMKTAMPLFFLIVGMFGFLALVCIGGGIYAIYSKAFADSTFDLLGFHLKSGHVGVAFIGIGLATAFYTTKAVLKKI
jgi:hypothetical protein